MQGCYVRRDMHPLILVVLLAVALVFPWWPAKRIVGDFIEYLRREAGIDQTSLDNLREEQREQIKRGKTVPPEEQIADDDVFDLPSGITGVFERYLAFVLVLFFGFDTSVGTILVAWIGAKLFANWQRQSGRGPALQDQIIRAHTLIALIVGTLSVVIGVISGWVARQVGWYLLAHKPF